MRRFKRKCEKSGILSELKKRQHYEKPSAKRKRKMIQARKKMLRKLSEETSGDAVTPGDGDGADFDSLEFGVVLRLVSALARTPPGRAAVLSLAPALEESRVAALLAETAEASGFQIRHGRLPLAGLDEIGPALDALESAGGSGAPEDSVRSCARRAPRKRFGGRSPRPTARSSPRTARASRLSSLCSGARRSSSPKTEASRMTRHRSSRQSGVGFAAAEARSRGSWRNSSTSGARRSATPSSCFATTATAFRSWRPRGAACPGSCTTVRARARRSSSSRWRSSSPTTTWP